MILLGSTVVQKIFLKKYFFKRCPIVIVEYRMQVLSGKMQIKCFLGCTEFPEWLDS